MPLPSGRKLTRRPWEAELPPRFISAALDVFETDENIGRQSWQLADHPRAIAAALSFPSCVALAPSHPVRGERGDGLAEEPLDELLMNVAFRGASCARR